MGNVRNIINFFELDPIWQAEAISNLDLEVAEQALYLEPAEHEDPEEHTLWDLTEAMRTGKDSEYDAVIGISNTSALGLKLSDDMEQAALFLLT